MKFASLSALKQVTGLSPWDSIQQFDWRSFLGFVITLTTKLPATVTSKILFWASVGVASHGALIDHNYRPEVNDLIDLTGYKFTVAYEDEFHNSFSKDVLYINLKLTGSDGTDKGYIDYWCAPQENLKWYPFEDILDMLIQVHSPVVIELQFADGTFVKYNSTSGQIEGTRPAFSNTIGDEPFILFIPSVPPGDYTLNATGTGSGSYHMEVILESQDVEGPIVSNIIFEGTTDTGEIDTYSGIVPPPPTITSINPKKHPHGGKSFPFTIKGSDFQIGTTAPNITLWLSAPNKNVTASKVVVSSNTTIKGKFRIPGSTKPGKYNVTVVNPDEQWATLVKGFKVKT